MPKMKQTVPSVNSAWAPMISVAPVLGNAWESVNSPPAVTLAISSLNGSLRDAMRLMENMYWAAIGMIA